MDDIRKKVLESAGITEFQRRVYLELLKVPAGETISYGELARRVGCRSARAVGHALHVNPFAPDVPCHRVIKSDGSLGGYAFGIEKKAALLEAEKTGSGNKTGLRCSPRGKPRASGDPSAIDGTIEVNRLQSSREGIIPLSSDNSEGKPPIAGLC